MEMPPNQVLEQARLWADADPDPEARHELLRLIDDESLPELRGRFHGRLAFGTAGLRGAIGAGPNRMNRAVVRQTSAGLSDYLRTHDPEAARAGVVIGYDGRHLSREMAEDTAAVLIARDIPAVLIPHPAPTPLVAFAVTHLRLGAGVMVTASHNPPQDNGYKVYWKNGAQIIPPHDRGIADAIGADLARLGPPGIGNAAAIPLADLDRAEIQGLLTRTGEELEADYLNAVQASLPGPRGNQKSPTIVYTPMHGVGRDLCTAALARAGFDRVRVVPEQAEPDPDFPTVRFPNPEEPGALDLALSLAKAEGADLILANDPDADRLAVVARDGDRGLVAFDGNQIGALLGDYLLEHHAPNRGRPLVVTSIVSSTMLAAIGAAHGAEHETVLTGFKWIANRALHREAQDPGLTFVFGYEEALGYTVGTVCRDKDGIGAAAAMAQLATACADEGRTLHDRLRGLYERHGLHLTRQKAVVMPGPRGAAQISAIMEGLRSDPPECFAGRRVLSHLDVQRGLRFSDAGEETVLLPPSNVLRFDLDGGATLTARPSGTEPKIKFYFEVRQSMDGLSPEAAHTAAARQLDALETALLAVVDVV